MFDQKDENSEFEQWTSGKRYERVGVRLKAKMEEYNDQPRVKMDVHALDMYEPDKGLKDLQGLIQSESGPILEAVVQRGIN